jgi:mycoredoxin
MNDTHMDTTKKSIITMYGTTWCSDCMRAKAYLQSVGAPYEFINIAEDDVALAKVLEINGGMQSVPTIVFPDGAVLVEPSNAKLEEQLSTLEK